MSTTTNHNHGEPAPKRALYREVWQDPDTGKITAPTPPSLVALDLDHDVRCAQEALAQVVTFIAELPRFGMESHVRETRMREQVLDLVSALNYLRDHTDSLNEWVRQQKAAQATEEVTEDA